MKFLNKFSLFTLLVLICSCANYNLHQTDNTKLSDAPKGIVTHSMFLIGDAAGATAKPTLNTLNQHLKTASENSTILFLGNNVAPTGMPSKSQTIERQAAETQLNAQIAALSGFKGRPVFIPGYKDWVRFGLKGIRRQEKYIEKNLNKGIENEDDWNNYFFPDNGCSGPEVIEINDQLVLIIIDSQWWLEDWDKNPNINKGCEVKTRAAFGLLVADAIKDHKDKNIVLAAHHTIESSGKHGGYYSVKDHLLPLPGIGTLAALVRESGVSRQDLNNNIYQDLREMLEHAVKGKGEFIFVAGNEQNLQYLQEENQHVVISGAGATKSPTANTNKTMFSYGHQGFSKLDFYEDGSVWVEFWTPEQGKSMGKLVYQYQMKEKIHPPSEDALPKDYSEYDKKALTSLQFPITTPIKPKRKVDKFMLGEHHIDAYLQQYEFPVLDISTYKGGLKVIKKGGGKQTNSLRFANAAGKEYVMRSLTKDLTRAVPYPFSEMALVTRLFKDNYLGAHPFAPLAVPTLADAAKVYHTNPELFYVPKQPALGIHNDKFGGEVYLVEERAAKSWPELASFGNGEKFVNTYNLAQKRIKNHHHQVDQKWVVRSRIFDMLIGDFDRHDDQWRWVVKDIDKKNKLYRPVPRDRDQAFSKYDGKVIKLLAPYNALLRQLANYEKMPKDFTWASYNTRHFDHSFLNELSMEDWLKETTYIQENLTDEIIEKAFDQFPTKIRQSSAATLIKALKMRRDNLKLIATGMYKDLARRTMVYGTEKSEYFEVIRHDDERTEINLYTTNKEKEKKKRFYHRVFKTSETEEIFLYGLADNDYFHISGKVNKGITLRFVGGLGKDTFIDESEVKGIKKKDRFYDSEKGNELQLNKEGKDLTNNITFTNSFDRLGTQFDKGSSFFLPTLGANADDGFFVGFIASKTKTGFNRFPYERKHTISFNTAFATNGINLKYDGEFIPATKKWDFVVHANWRSNRYAFNFFGLGNETNQLDDNIGFYRVRQRYLNIDAGWQRRFLSNNGRFSIKPSFISTEIQSTDNRFIDQSDILELFDSKQYGGLKNDFNIVSVDNEVSPRNGFRYNAYLNWYSNLNSTDRQFTAFGTDFTLYNSFGEIRKLIFASRIGTELIRGDYDFFFAPSLGQKENLRGFYGQRFRGNTSFFHTSDLRLELGSSNNAVLPFSFGITGSFDYGRVWLDNENSNQWHSSYGGGFWLVPLNLAVISFNYNKSDIDQRFMIKLGHSF